MHRLKARVSASPVSVSGLDNRPLGPLACRNQPAELATMKRTPHTAQTVGKDKLRTFSRRRFLSATVALGALAVARRMGCPLAAGPFPFEPESDLILAPEAPEDWPEFRRRLVAWRAIRRQELHYSDQLYRCSDFAWASANFACCFLMLCDEQFYDPRSGRYTVGSFLDHGRREFGGYDSVVLWHAYPRIGIDPRNQFDFYRDMPGGLPGLAGVVAQFHRCGLRVYLDYNPWDVGTRRENRSDLECLVEMVRALEADGLFLDTMTEGAAALRTRLDAARPGVVLEGEVALPLARVHDHHLSWAQWFTDGAVPGVLRNKWFERRHLQHQVKRWDYDHTGELQCAWMNGSGMLVWENVFGSWMGWNARDRSLLRAILPIQRRFAPLFAGEHWTPLVPTLASNLYASLWEGNGVRLWTLVNRGDQSIEGDLLRIPVQSTEHLFDLVAGRQIQIRPVPAEPSDPTPGCCVAPGRLAPRGLGCLVAGTADVLGPDFGAFLRRQRALARRAQTDTTYPRRETRLSLPPTTGPHLSPPPGMIEIPAANLTLRIEIRERECGGYESAPPPGHDLAGSYRFKLRTVVRPATFGRYAMDRTPVTNLQYAAFLAASGYRPRHPEYFLRHWSSCTPPAALLHHPVVYVDLEDARAYARWAGKRLPTEEEWQYAAQGPDGRPFPWGDTLEPGRCNGGQTGGTTPVNAFPSGASPFGLLDCCGNTWEWTESERSDGRTRFCMIRGGSFYTARGSNWYMDGGPRPAPFTQKFLLTWAGLDRCATIGFRCAAELA